MIIEGSATNNWEYHHSFLANGIHGILKFPLLHKILGRFSKFEEKRYDANYFLTLASKSIWDIFSNGPHKGSEQILFDLNKFLQDINFEETKKEKKEDIKAKMCSFDPVQNTSIFNELVLWKFFFENNMISKVDYSYGMGINNDFILLIEGLGINIEFTIPQKCEIITKIEQAFNSSAEQLLSFIPDNHMLIVRIDPERLKGRTTKDIPLIMNQIIEDFKRIKSIACAKFGNIRLHDFICDCSLKELLDKSYIKPETKEILNELSKSSEFTSYLNQSSQNITQNNCIDSVSYLKSKFAYVKIKTKYMLPSVWASELFDLSLRSLYFSIRGKIEHKQLSGKKNSFLLLRFGDPLLMSYLEDSDILFNSEVRQKIIETVYQVFIDLKEQEIQGVLLFQQSPDKAVIIENPNIKIDEKVLTLLKKAFKNNY